MLHYLRENNILYFLHIPKTGGTTLISILDNYHNYEFIFQDQVWNRVLPKLPQDFSQFKLIRGHFGYGVYRILPKKPLYITMLREPIEHTISFYNHIKRDPKNNRWIPPDYISEGETLIDLLQDSSKKDLFFNFQTQHIAIDVDVLSKIKFRDLSDRNVFFYELELSKIAKEIPSQELLKLAKKHLSEFTFFGLLEKYFESLCLLWYTFGWKPIRTIPKYQIDPTKNKQKNFSEETVSEIKKATELDLELYQFARKEFDLRFTHMLNELKQKYNSPHIDALPVNEQLYELLEKHYEENNWKDKDPVYSVNYTFNQALLGSGWYPREHEPANNTLFRWSGPENDSTLDFPALQKEGNYKMSIEIRRFMSDEILSSLKVFVNDDPVDLKLEKKEGKQRIFEGIFFFRKNGKNFLSVRCSVKKTISPSSVLKDSLDIRLLGLGFSKITITPVV